MVHCTLLEGLGKTIDHRFFVEDSDHRRIWNDNLFTHMAADQEHTPGRDFVPARVRQRDEFGQAVVAVNILSGPGVVSKEQEVSSQDGTEKSNVNSKDLIDVVDW
jgi:hypothetical protein